MWGPGLGTEERVVWGGPLGHRIRSRQLDHRTGQHSRVVAVEHCHDQVVKGLKAGGRTVPGDASPEVDSELVLADEDPAIAMLIAKKLGQVYDLLVELGLGAFPGHDVGGWRRNEGGLVVASREEK
ncbi:hypothetical protein PF007_g9029 [Phytophthora fragariae]|uniref:Uncharacterized protein n=1 Tax=Phytophthora fragariae TaxID=53985 RepID=A0A6A3SJI5_9STRA|nr:hypothetical protein PF007_g9029 [Phytophthora fragariae]